jgi:hypothetical protein
MGPRQYILFACVDGHDVGAVYGGISCCSKMEEERPRASNVVAPFTHTAQGWLEGPVCLMRPTLLHLVDIEGIGFVTVALCQPSKGERVKEERGGRRAGQRRGR